MIHLFFLDMIDLLSCDTFMHNLYISRDSFTQFIYIYVIILNMIRFLSNIIFPRDSFISTCDIVYTWFYLSHILMILMWLRAISDHNMLKCIFMWNASDFWSYKLAFSLDETFYKELLKL